MIAIINLEKIYDKVVDSIFKNVNKDTSLLKNKIKNANLKQLKSMGEDSVSEWVEDIMVKVLIKETLNNIVNSEESND